MMCWRGFLSLTTKAVAEREKLRIPPLRYAPVGMTRGGRLLYGRMATREDRDESVYKD
jgi:hypothetical protein